MYCTREREGSHHLKMSLDFKSNHILQYLLDLHLIATVHTCIVTDNAFQCLIPLKYNNKQ